MENINAVTLTLDWTPRAFLPNGDPVGSLIPGASVRLNLDMDGVSKGSPVKAGFTGIGRHGLELSADAYDYGSVWVVLHNPTDSNVALQPGVLKLIAFEF